MSGNELNGKQWYTSKSILVSLASILAFVILRLCDLLGAPEPSPEDAYLIASLVIMILLRLQTERPIRRRKKGNLVKP
jgi:hypothetical protein